jgi:DNA-binding NarL/FixJ family response regulator
MAFRVREVLLVSSRYDAFVLEEDGHLTEQVFLEYKSLSLSSAPHFTHANRREDALELLSRRRFDLVLLVAREANREALELAREVKRLHPGQAVALLGFEGSDLSELAPCCDIGDLDGTFVWNGDVKILLAIVKTVEDRANVDRDIALVGVRVILVVEDSVQYYSSFLSVIYPEMMKQSQSLFSEGLNRLQRLLRMRTRPKILHARSYEQALEEFNRYRDQIIGVISDIGYPREGRLDPRAGLRLARHIRTEHPDMPLLLQSAELDVSAEAKALRALFVAKDSPALLQTVRSFLTDNLGFGPFVFRLPDGREVDRAHSVREMLERLDHIPEDSVVYHAARNHFSHWLMARSEFEIAAGLRPVKVSDFGSVEELKQHLRQVLIRRGQQASQGVVTDFDPLSFDEDALFQRIGEGSVGGKARGLAFLNLVLAEESEGRLATHMPVRIPQTFALATSHYERFLEENRLFDVLSRGGLTDAEIRSRVGAARLPDDLLTALAILARRLEGPLAVRSSSLLEDDMLHPFAGIYGTAMLPHSAPSEGARLEDLCRAVKAIYATTFLENPRVYLQNTGHRVEEERMGVVIQRVVGQRLGSRFYPHFSGVAHSYNFYPVGAQRANEGVAQVVLGLGRMVVDGGHGVRFCPRHPQVQPQFATPRLMLRYSQRLFYGLDLERPWNPDGQDLTSNQAVYDLETAIQDGTFSLVGSVVDIANDVVTESLHLPGPRVVTFANLLKHRAVPLAETLSAVLEVAADAMGTPVEIEFACDMGDYGRNVPRGAARRAPTIYLLQVRPIQVRESLREMELADFDPDALFCHTRRILGHGHYGALHDVVYVKPEAFNPSRSPEIAAEVGQINERLRQEERAYVLIGPGRWGSSDHWLGIPVQWSQISAARIIVEASPAGYDVEPSQGSHFFHNLTALRLGYLTIAPGATRQDPRQDSWLDWAWLDRQPALQETKHLRLIRTEPPCVAHLDGRRGQALLVKPGRANPDPYEPAGEA